MFANENGKKKAVSFAMAVLMMACACTVVFYGDISVADEGGPALSEELSAGGDTVIEYRGVYYIVTDDTESDEKMSVFGVTDGTTVAIVLCTLEYDEVLYTVTGVSADFKDHCASSGVSLYLAETVELLESGCFSGITFSNTVLVATGTEGQGECGVSVSEASSVAFTASFDKGDISYPQPEYQEQDDMDDQEIYGGLTMLLDECGYDYPHHEIDFWSFGSTDLEIGDASSLTVIGGILYVDGEDTGEAVSDSVNLTANWTEEGNDYDESYMWATVAIIVILAVIGLSMHFYRSMAARRS